MTMGLLVGVVIPFTIFYYEADSDRTTVQRWRDAALWVLLSDAVVGAAVGVAYGPPHSAAPGLIRISFSDAKGCES
jgi:hypothetical protein